jgi:hypothetical protein
MLGPISNLKRESQFREHDARLTTVMENVLGQNT